MTWVPSTQVPAVSRALRAFVYGVQVFLSFFLMLVFMTYNVRHTLYRFACQMTFPFT